MLDSFNWININTETTNPEVSLVSLTTCAYCAHAKHYLTNRKIPFRFIELDTLPAEKMEQFEKEFEEIFGRKPPFPALILNNKEFLSGFIKPHWDMIFDSAANGTGENRISRSA